MKIRQIYADVISELKFDYPQDNFQPTILLAYIMIPCIAIAHSLFIFALQNELLSRSIYIAILGLVSFAILANTAKLPQKISKFKLYSFIPSLLIGISIITYYFPNIFIITAPLIILLLLLLVIWLEGWILPISFIITTLILFISNHHLFESNIFFDVFIVFEKNQTENINYGIFGIAWQAMINTVYAFLLLTAALRMVRIDKLLNFIAFRLTHGRRQGASAGLYAVIDSALYGSMSGSAEDNINKTGRYTIDLMRQSGYQPIFAASIEAVASSAGKVIPPVMGVVAFIILEVEPHISYMDLMIGSLLPAFLFLFALSVAIAIEANKQNLKPLDINYAQKELKFKNEVYDKHIKFLTRLIISIITILFAISFFTNLSLAVYPTIAAIIIFISALWSPDYKVVNRKYKYFVDLFKSLVETGKDGIFFVISCAMIGLLLFVLQQVGLFELTGKYSAQVNHFLADQTAFFSLRYEVTKFLILLVIAYITLHLGKHLPAIAVYLLMAFIAPHFLAIVDVESLHAHLFLLYYAVLAGLTPPFAPIAGQAAKVINEETQVLIPTINKLGSVMFILPIAWLYHPEIILKLSDITSLNQDTFIIFNIIALMLAIIAITAANFSHFRQDLSSSYQKSFLWLSVIIIVFINYWILKIVASIIILWILIKNDLETNKRKNIKQLRESFFRPAFDLLNLVLKPKNIPIPTYFTFLILAIIYIGLFTINGFALRFEKQIINPFIHDRFQVMLGVEQCDTKVQTMVADYFQQQGYTNISSLCTEFITQASVSKQEPGEFSLINDERQIALIGFKPAFFNFINHLEQNLTDNFNQEIMSYTGKCFRYENEQYDQQQQTYYSSLRDVNFNLNKPIEHSCNQYTPHQLPVVYVGKQLMDKMNVSTGTLIRIHERIYFENMGALIEKINDSNANQFFVVGATFETGIEQMDTAILLPQHTLKNLDFEPEQRLLVKLGDLSSLNQLEQIELNLLTDDTLHENLEYQFYSLITASNGLFHSIMEANNTLEAIQYSMLLVCLIVLVSAMIQLVESQARMIALMRMSGLHGMIIWLFLFLLSAIVVSLACFIGIISTFLIDITTLSTLIFGNIKYDLNGSEFFQLYGISLIFAIITTILLKIYYFSHDIFRELTYANRRA